MGNPEPSPDNNIGEGAETILFRSTPTFIIYLCRGKRPPSKGNYL